MATYIVVKGDTLSTLSIRLGCSLQDLEKSNPAIKNPNQLSIGEQVHVPGDAKNTTYHVKSGDTGTSIAKSDNTTYQQLEKLNPNVNWNDLVVGSTLVVPRD